MNLPVVIKTPRPRPGTLTVQFGEERATLDPLSSHQKFEADKERVNEIIEKMRRAAEQT